PAPDSPRPRQPVPTAGRSGRLDSGLGRARGERLGDVEPPRSTRIEADAGLSGGAGPFGARAGRRAPIRGRGGVEGLLEWIEGRRRPRARLVDVRPDVRPGRAGMP